MILLKDDKVTVIQVVPEKTMGTKHVKNNYLAFWLPIHKNKVGVMEQKAEKYVASFQVCLRTTLVIGQLFSLLPVNGVWSKKASDVKFVWASWKCTYSVLSLLGQIFITIMCIHKVLHSPSSLNGTTPIIFYSTTCITMLIFFKVARMWPALVKEIARIEDLDPYHNKSLANKCNATCAIVLSLALLEHILSLLSAIAGTIACISNELSYRHFVQHFYPWVFNYLPYTVWLGALTQFLHFQSTFIWNFSDLFVICMSYYLTARLDHVNQKLLNAQGKYLPEVFWRTTREDYGRAVHLVRRVDEVISGIIFISFANNLFFICLQLFNTLEDGIKGQAECSNREKGKTNLLGGYEAALYFLFSLFYLIARSVSVSLIASQVNTASTVPAPVLYDVPSPVYCVENKINSTELDGAVVIMSQHISSPNLVVLKKEKIFSNVQRFLDQVNGDKVALSGLQFFSITKGLLLTVAGTIVTYELVMFQFNTTPSTPNTINSTPLSLINITTPAFDLNV